MKSSVSLPMIEIDCDLVKLNYIQKRMYYHKLFLFFFLWMRTSAVKIVSTSSDNTICEYESFYGSPGYIQDMQEINQVLAGIENGFEHVKLFVGLPMNSGCHYNELEVIVIVDEDTDDQLLLDLRDDIQNNLDRIIEIKLIIVSDLNELPWQLRNRLADVEIPIVNQLRGEVNRRVNFQMETDIRLVLFQIATELNILIAQVRCNANGNDISVQLADRNGNGDRITRNQRNRFLLMARARTRRTVRVV